MRIRADGTGLSEVFNLDLGGGFDYFSLSADATKVIFTGLLVMYPPNLTILSIKLDGTGLTDLSRGNGDYSPAWSR